MGKFRLVFPLIIISFVLGACSPQPAEIPPLPTSTETQVPSATATLEPSQTPTSTDTPIPPTITPTSTPDFTQIKLIGAYDIHQVYGSFTQIIIEMGTLTGNYYGMVDGVKYKCSFRNDFPTQMNCFGPNVFYGRNYKFALYSELLQEPIFNSSFIFTSPPPTPVGMYCEIEGLWTELVGKIGGVGCYAVTCWINGVYYGGTQDSCKNPWPWIPPGLIPTPSF